MIPASWESVQLGSIANLYQPTTIGSASFDLSGFPVYGANGKIGNYKFYNHAKWQTIIACRGSCGDVNRTEDFSWINGNAMVANVDDNGQIDKEFFYHLLKAQNFRNAITGSGIPQITRGPLAEHYVLLPPVEEQAGIGEALSDADAAIDSLDALIAKKRDVKHATMQQLLTGRARLPGFTVDWKEVRLGDLGSFSKGAGIRKDDVVSAGVPCVRYGQLYTEHDSVIRSIRSFVSTEVASTSRPLVVGEILFAGSGETKAEIGKCVAYVDGIGAVAGGDLVILTPKKCSSIFLGYALNSPKVVRQKMSRAQGDAVVHISAASLATVVVGLPPLKEQEAIAETLSVMDDELEALTKQVSKLRMVKEGMMQDLLTGKVRLV